MQHSHTGRQAQFQAKPPAGDPGAPLKTVVSAHRLIRAEGCDAALARNSGSLIGPHSVLTRPALTASVPLAKEAAPVAERRCRSGQMDSALWAKTLEEILRSDAAAVAGDFDLRDLRRDQPGVERIAREVLRAGDAHPPRFQRDDLDVKLLAGGEVDIFVLVEVLTEALGRDVIMPGRNIAIEGAAVCDSPEKIAVYV